MIDFENWETLWLAWLERAPFLALVLLFLMALLLLSFFADRLVDVAVLLAQRLHLSPLVIGATIISLGTTVPEVSVSVVAAFKGAGELALGNGVGSIIVDTALILGLVLSSCKKIPLYSLELQRSNIWREVSAAALALAVMLTWFLRDSAQTYLPRFVGWFLVFLLVCYLVYYFRHVKNKEVEKTVQAAQTTAAWFLVLLVLCFLLGLFLASQLLVYSGLEIAKRWEIPESILAVSVVALGTSLPELATALTAIRKNQIELAIGNVFGADTLNALFVVGTAASIAPLGIDRYFIYFHLPMMLLVVFALRIFALKKQSSHLRWRLLGAFLLTLYLLYLFILFSVGTQAHTPL